MLRIIKATCAALTFLALLSANAFAVEPEAPDSVGSDSLRIESNQDTLAVIGTEDSTHFARRTIIVPIFYDQVEQEFSYTLRIYPESLIVRYREFNDMLIGESFLPVLIGPPGQSRTIFINGNPSSNPYLNYNGGIVPETYWSLPHFRGPDLNSFPTEGIGSIAVLDGPAAIAEGFNAGPETIDIRTQPIDTELDSSQSPKTNVTVWRAPAEYHKTGITISRSGPLHSNLRAIIGIISSTGYLPRSDYSAHYVGLTSGFKIGDYPIELSAFRYRGRGQYTIFDYYMNQNAKFSRDLICISAKSKFAISDSSLLMVNAFINRRPHTAVDNSYKMFYGTINTALGLSSDYEYHAGQHLIYSGLKVWYEKMDDTYMGDPDMYRGSLTAGDIFLLSKSLKLLTLIRYDGSDTFDGGLSGSAGLNLRMSSSANFYLTAFRQTIFPDLQTINWPPSSYPPEFNPGIHTYLEDGGQSISTGYRHGIEFGVVRKYGIFDNKSGISFTLCDDLIHFANTGNEQDIIYAPLVSDYKISSIFSRLQVNNLLKMFNFISGVRYSSIAYDNFAFNQIPEFRFYAGGNISREIFIKRLYFSAGLEADFTSARYIPGILPRHENSYWVVNSNLSIKYKDLTFFFNGDNIFDQIYYSNGYNPVLGGYNWWGLSWDFFN